MHPHSFKHCLCIGVKEAIFFCHHSAAHELEGIDRKMRIELEWDVVFVGETRQVQAGVRPLKFVGCRARISDP
jgi:hypothetical protein